MTEGILALPEPFSLGLTLLCGQCFRWEGPDSNGWFQGVAGGVHWRLRENERRLSWVCSSPTVKQKPADEWLARYLSLDEDLDGWTQSVAGDFILAGPVKFLRGLRLLRQEPWECTISYMFAQGLSVTVIRKALHKFCEKYGKPVPGFPGFYTFPEPGDLAHLTPELLRPFTNNYRARADRIIRLSRVVAARVIDLDHLKDISCDQAREALRNMDGVGPKIADCILLFSMNHSAAFPVDRWVLRAMKKYFPSVHLFGRSNEAPTPSQYLKIVHKARKVFGEKCGLASEYLFLYLRLLEDEKLQQELSPFCQFTDRLLVPLQARGSSKSKKRIAPC